CYLAWRVRCAYPPWRGCGVGILTDTAGALRLPALHNKTYELCRVGKRSAPTTRRNQSNCARRLRSD
ncbi:hypothetical protein AUN14_18195, partial [Cronobacter muytjensii]